MHLFKKETFILFFGLMDTPEDVNYGIEVAYDDLPPTERWVAYQINHEPQIIEAIIERVKLCRLWLIDYDKQIQKYIGKINITT